MLPALAAIFSFSFALLMGFQTFARTLEPQTMRDWSVRCSDTRYCVAQTSGVSAQGDKMLFKLERSINVDAGIFLTTAPEVRKLSLESHITISVAGGDFSVSGPVGKVYDGNEAAFKKPFADESINRLRLGRFAQVSVKFKPDEAPVIYDLSLQGVSSVLAMMDIVQGRLDREDAAVVVGGEAKTLASHYDFSAGKAPPKPNVDEKSAETRDPEENIDYPDEDQTENLPNEESGIGTTDLVYVESKLPSRVLMPGYRMLNCDLPSTVEAWGAKVINLAPGQFLYLVPCFNADVNIPYYVAMEDAGEVDTLEFQVPASATGQPEALLTNATWDQQNESLISTKFFSPNRDCGQYEKHTFSHQDNRFYLSEYRLKQTCDGKVSPPETFPMEWNGEGD